MPSTPANPFIEDISISDQWTRIAINDDIYTIKNIGDDIVYMCGIDNPEDITPEQARSLAVTLGGINGKVVYSNKYVWARTAKPGDDSSLRIIPYGLFDPSEDISQLAAAINDAVTILRNHLKELGTNPHEVNKKNVELDNIPNEITSRLDQNRDDVLLTGAAGVAMVELHHEHADIIGNVHGVTKGDVELGNVPNWEPVTEETALDITNKTSFMNPWGASLLMDHIIKVSCAYPPQCILNAAMGVRPLSWTKNDASLPTAHMTKITGNQLRIASGLRVSFVFDGKVFASQKTTANQTLVINTTVTGYKYIYANLNAKNEIIEYDWTVNPPASGMLRDGSPFDFFDRSSMVFLDQNDLMIRRCYLGKVYMVSNVIQEVYNIPLGTVYIHPVQDVLTLGGRAMFANPFMDEIETEAQVEYSGRWGNSRWNDQIGVTATPTPGDAQSITVQVGKVGFLADGGSSGSAFGSNFTTITSPIRTRTIIRKLI